MSVMFCDSNSELWHDLADEVGLKVIKMPYILDGEEYYYDLGKATDFNKFYRSMRGGSTPTTAALNTFNYIEYFEPVLASGEDILYVTFSHEMSATFNYMEEAIAQLKEKYPDRTIRTFDTKSISMGCGFQVYYAALLHQKGATDDEVLAFLEDFTSHVGTYFVVDNLVYLQRGGRISKAKAFGGTMLGLKPVIKVTEQGTLVNCSKVHGAKKVVPALVNLVAEQGENFDQYDIWIMQADCPEQAKELEAQLKEKLGANITVHTTLVGPVVASHCGPGTLGVIFPAKNR